MKLIAVAATLTALSGVIGAPVAYNLVTAASTAGPLASAAPRAATGPQAPCAAPGIEQDGICVTEVVVTLAPAPASAGNESAIAAATASQPATQAASADAPSPPPLRTQHETNDDHGSGEAGDDRDHD